MDKINAYLAGPVVFQPNAAQVLGERVQLCRSLGMDATPPADNGEHAQEGVELARAIYAGNLDRMFQCNAVIANISPFRGPNMDPGTAFEIGWFAGKGAPVVLWSEDPHDLRKRVNDWEGHREHLDREGLLIEDFGLPENLMIALSSPVVHRSFREAAQWLSEHAGNSHGGCI